MLDCIHLSIPDKPTFDVNFTRGSNEPGNEPNTNTTVSSCLSKKRILVYVETSNVLQRDIFLSFKGVKAKIKKRKKKRNEHPPLCTQNVLQVLLTESKGNLADGSS